VNTTDAMGLLFLLAFPAGHPGGCRLEEA